MAAAGGAVPTAVVAAGGAVPAVVVAAAAAVPAGMASAPVPPLRSSTLSPDQYNAVILAIAPLQRLWKKANEAGLSHYFGERV